MSTAQPSLQFSVMCLDLVEDERKPPTLQYLFYELPFPQLPFRMDRFHIINCWSNGTGQYKQAIKILTPSKTKTFVETGEQAFNLDDLYTPQLMINVFADLEFTEEGHYIIQNFLNGKLVMEYPLTVRLAGGGAKPAAPKPAEVITEKKPASPSSTLPPFTYPDEWNIPK